MDKRRQLTGLVICVLAGGCTYNIVLEPPEDTAPAIDAKSATAMSPAKAADPSARSDDRAPAGTSAPPPMQGQAAADGPAKPAAPPPAPAPGDKPAAPAQPAKPAEPSLPDGCSERVVSRAKPCTNDPDPCRLNSGYEGDEYCLKPPKAGEGIQIHFGPTNYFDPNQTKLYELQPGDEFDDSMLANVPLPEDRFWYRVTAHARPTAHHWTSTGARRGGKETVYSEDTTCGGSALPEVNAFRDSRNRIYDQPPQGIPAPENEGLGYPIAADSSVCVTMHAYNFTDKPQLRELWVNLYFIDEADITQKAGTIRMTGGLRATLPPGQQQETTISGMFPGPGRILQLGGERHRWTPRLAAWLNDDLIYDSHDWLESVSFNFDSLTMNPPIDGTNDGALSGIVEFQAGDTLKYTCFVNNQSDIPLTPRTSFADGEVCNLWGITVGASLGD